jgi:hypothetical protein
MTTFDPFKGLDRVREYQERVVVQAVRLTRDNADEIARRARKSVDFTPEGKVVLLENNYMIWAFEGDMVFARPGSMRLSVRIPDDFRAWYTKPGAPISEEDLA